MGGNKKHKAKKHKAHSREIKEDEDATSSGKMKVVFRVPPPHPPSPPEPSFIVSLPIEDIARARQSRPDDTEIATPTKSHKKHKRKRHHHGSKSSSHVLGPPSEYYGSTSERDDEDNEQRKKTTTQQQQTHRAHGKGKDLNFHKIPGKEIAYQKAHLGPPCLDVIESEEEEGDIELMDTSDHYSKPKREKKDVSSLPVEINLDMLTLSPGQRHRHRPRGSGGKDMSLFKVPQSSPPLSNVSQSTSFQTPPTQSSSPVVKRNISADLSNQSGLSDEGDKKKKRKKKKKHRNKENLSKKSKKSVKSSTQPPSPIHTQQNIADESIEEDPSILYPDSAHQDDSSDVVEPYPQEPSQALPLKKAQSPTDTSPIVSVPSPSSSSSSRLHQGVKLPRSALRYFLKHILHQIQRNDPEGVFSEPVTDDIAPNYSTIIKQPMDLQTMASKIDSNSYSTVEEFKDDFILMCTNAMTYNTPETQYYQFSKQLLNFGIKLIQKEVSIRPDIRLGMIPVIVAASPQPPLSVQPPSDPPQLDYSSPFVCKLELSSLRPAAAVTPTTASGYNTRANASSHQTDSGSGVNDESTVVDVSGEPMEEEVVDQSHLTQVQVGFDHEEDDPTLVMFNKNDNETGEEEILQIVDHAFAEMKDTSSTIEDVTPQPELSYLADDEDGKTFLHVLNPHSVSPCPVNLNVLADKVKAGENASTVLNTELPVFKATPVSYLMYGPFGSFAPTYDTSFANLTKHDSSLLVSTYGNELGVNYANSLQQFVKGCGSFATEMADAILNSLTNGRHMKFMESVKKDETKNKLIEEKKKVKVEDISGGNSAGDPAGVDSGKEGTLQISTDNSGGDSMKGRGNKEVKLTEDNLEKKPIPDDSINDTEECLSRASNLLLQLESKQNDRLSLPPQSQGGTYTLTQPTESEVHAASQVTSELVSLASSVTPGNLVSVNSLHQAMGVDHDSSIPTTSI